MLFEAALCEHRELPTACMECELATLRARIAELEARPNFVDDVRAFHAKFGVPDLPTPSELDEDRRNLRRALILEESIETSEAIERAELVQIADGIADTIYVCIGAALEFGIPIERVWAEVHRTNMAKEGGATRADGKILKPEGWSPPDIARILDAARASAGERGE